MSVVESRITGHTVYPGTCFTVAVGTELVCAIRDVSVPLARVNEQDALTSSTQRPQSKFALESG
jgi:hypothetical protein